MVPRSALLLCADEEVHDLVETWLMKVGVNVISADDGKNAESVISDQPIDFLIIDSPPIFLPDLPSLRLLKQKSRNLRVILVPTQGEIPDVSVARISGVDAVLTRPLRRAALLSALEA
jgi:DNA-binding response OmpR family regulator